MALTGLMILIVLTLSCDKKGHETNGEDWLKSADQLSENLVFGGYLPWHASKEVESFWCRWNDEGRIPENNDISSMFWPQKGLYSSGDTATLRLQAEEMKNAGIDAVIIFWNNAYRDEQKRVEKAMQVFGKEGLRGIVAVDFNWSLPGSSFLDDMVNRLDIVVNQYAKESKDNYNDFYYKDPVSGYPVFMVYGPFVYGEVSYWNEIIRNYKNNDPESGIFIGGKVADISKFTASYFDGVFWTGHAASTDDQEGHEYHMNSLARNMFYIGGVITGFDESHRPYEEVTVLDRNGGGTFNLKWQAVINAENTDGDQVDHVYVPFNDWGEGIGIEPVADNPPERMEGYNDPYDRVPKTYYTNAPLPPDAYLKLNYSWADEFRKTRE